MNSIGSLQIVNEKEEVLLGEAVSCVSVSVLVMYESSEYGCIDCRYEKTAQDCRFQEIAQTVPRTKHRDGYNPGKRDYLVLEKMAIDTLVFRDDGAESYTMDPALKGIFYCAHCRSWHAKLRLETGTEFCAFCRTTHHSRACGAGLGQRCANPRIDPIHAFMEKECREHQKFDLNYCRECNCFHSKQGWKMCLEANGIKPSWGRERKLVWKMRWRACESETEMKSERSLFNMAELIRTLPYEYPFLNAKFVHHCNV